MYKFYRANPRNKSLMIVSPNHIVTNIVICQSGSGQMSVSATDPKFDKAHSFYLKKFLVVLARNKIRRVNQKRKRLSWSCIVPVAGDDSDIVGATATDTNLSGLDMLS